MRNIFDQYSTEENRLTHAVVSALGSDSKLLRRFVKWACGSVPSGRIKIIEQQLPGEEGGDNEQKAERRGLPDAWIHNNQDWALICESKIQAPLSMSQLLRHRRTAECRGFSDIQIIAFVAKRSQESNTTGVRVIEWTELYSWLRRERQSEWASRVADYMEILEEKLAEQGYLREGTLTVFAGIPFDQEHPYSYREAKRLLDLSLDELRRRKSLKTSLRADPTGPGRPAITGREASSVWDFLPLAAAREARAFTEYPHLTLGIRRDSLRAIVTIPNGIRPKFRRNLLREGPEAFIALIERVHKNLHDAIGSVDGAVPYMEIVQRHHLSQRSRPIEDARLEFDLRTAFRSPKRWRRHVKNQHQWVETAYKVLSNKNANVQAAIGASFSYKNCPSVHTPGILDHIADTWLACRPLIQTTIA